MQAMVMQRAAAVVGAAPQSTPRGSRRPTKKQTSHEQPASCDSLVSGSRCAEKSSGSRPRAQQEVYQEARLTSEEPDRYLEADLRRMRRHSLSLLRGRGFSACVPQSWPVRVGLGRQV